jgi:hypothetical protein
MSAETLGPHQSSVTVDKQEKIAHMGEQLTQKKNDPRSDYLQKTNEEQVDFIIRGSSAPMEQPQVRSNSRNPITGAATAPKCVCGEGTL